MKSRSDPRTGTFSTVVRQSGDQPEITISTSDADRQDDVLEPSGVQLDAYRKNPVVLFGHQYSTLPIGAATSVQVDASRGIRAKWKWLQNDPFADRVRNAFAQGMLRAASVGFKPIACEPRGIGQGLRFTDWELLEFSLVPVPANPAAVRTLKSLELWPADDEIILDIDEPDEIDVDPATVRGIVTDLVTREVTQMLRRQVATEVHQKLLRLRGRVD